MSTILITGSTGMLGKGVLLEAIADPRIESIVLLNRTTVNFDHPKIKEILLSDFTKLDEVKNQLGWIDGCMHCMGVSSIGLSEEEFMKPTYELTKKIADVCFEINPNMTFNYISGAGTDTTEKGRQMWARVKGKTENYILSKGFAKAYMFRPGAILPEKGLRSRTVWYDRLYRILRPLFPLLKRLKSVTTTTKLSTVMLECVFREKLSSPYLSNKEVNQLAKDWEESI